MPSHIVGPDNNWDPTWEQREVKNGAFLQVLEKATCSLSTGSSYLGQAEKDLEGLTNDWLAIAINEIEQATGQPGPENCHYHTQMVSVAKLVKPPVPETEAEVDEAEWFWRRLNELASLDLA